jgi:hypothetical protein
MNRPLKETLIEALEMGYALLFAGSILLLVAAGLTDHDSDPTGRTWALTIGGLGFLACLAIMGISNAVYKIKNRRQ